MGQKYRLSHSESLVKGQGQKLQETCPIGAPLEENIQQVKLHMPRDALVSATLRIKPALQYGVPVIHQNSSEQDHMVLFRGGELSLEKEKAIAAKLQKGNSYQPA